MTTEAKHCDCRICRHQRFAKHEQTTCCDCGKTVDKTQWRTLPMSASWYCEKCGNLVCKDCRKVVPGVDWKPFCASCFSNDDIPHRVIA